MKHRVTEELHVVLAFVGLIWVVFLIDAAIPFQLNQFGLAPRRTSGLIGIVAMPFLHGSFSHLLGNTVPLVVLLTLMAGSRADTLRVVPVIILVNGILLWMFGRGNAVHVGASGLIYGLIAFLMVAGFREGRLMALAVAILVGFLYGTTLISGILPIVNDAQVSWDGHLFGAIAGGIVAMGAVRRQSLRSD
ncbi:MAG: rhomboid family intramembrane serine protease [Planctomycetaceae bacterium]